MLEADDEVTRAAVKAIALPAFVQVLVAPPGSPKTKPPACNYALDVRGTLRKPFGVAELTQALGDLT